MEKVIVIDWLDKYGGAERVIRYLDQIFSFDKMYTLINIMKEDDLDKIQNYHKRPVIDTVLRKIGPRFRWFFPTYFGLIKSLKIDKDVDLIISSSHSVAKGVQKSNPNQIHISYFQQRNNNYIWDEPDLYLGKFKYVLAPLLYFLRKLDLKQAKNPDYIISNSIYTQQWVKKRYNRDSEVVYPPIDFSVFTPSYTKDDYYVVVGRLATIKKFDLVIKAFNTNGKPLIIIGDGDEAAYLKSIAKDNIKFLGFLESSEINPILNQAKAFIQMGVEGFGIAPVEAQYCGTPVIGYGFGALLETVIDQQTGILFNQQTEKALNDAIIKFEQISFDYEMIHHHAKKFSIESFNQNILACVKQLTD